MLLLNSKYFFLIFLFLNFSFHKIPGSLIKTRLRRDNESEFCQRHCSPKQRELEIQMVIVLVVITMVFMVSWSPLDVSIS